MATVNGAASAGLRGETSGRRLALARWLTQPDHPLTARVFVNRVWQHHFGRGIVETLGNFGRSGSLPSHPELLDWLAVDFMENGWSTKRLHRQIMMSTAYRQSSRRPPRGADEATVSAEKRLALANWYAESDDGITWRKPKVGLIAYRGNKDNNVILTGQRASEQTQGALTNFDGYTILRDDREPNPDRRYKMVGLTPRWTSRAILS